MLYPLLFIVWNNPNISLLNIKSIENPYKTYRADTIQDTRDECLDKEKANKLKLFGFHFKKESYSNAQTIESVQPQQSIKTRGGRRKCDTRVCGMIEKKL